MPSRNQSVAVGVSIYLLSVVVPWFSRRQRTGRYYRSSPTGTTGWAGPGDSNSCDPAPLLHWPSPSNGPGTTDLTGSVLPAGWDSEIPAPGSYFNRSGR